MIAERQSDAPESNLGGVDVSYIIVIQSEAKNLLAASDKSKIFLD